MSYSKKMDRRSVKTCQFGEMKWVIVRYYDGQLSKVLKGTEVEDEETGLSVQDGHFTKGKCMAKWTDGHMYEGEILFVTMDKEEAAKQQVKLKKPASDKSASGATTSASTTSKPQKRNVANQEASEITQVTQPPTKKNKGEKAEQKEAEIAAQKIMVTKMLDQFRNEKHLDSSEEIKTLKRQNFDLKKSNERKEEEIAELKTTLVEVRGREAALEQEVNVLKEQLTARKEDTCSREQTNRDDNLQKLARTTEVRQFLTILTAYGQGKANEDCLPVLSSPRPRTAATPLITSPPLATQSQYTTTPFARTVAAPGSLSRPTTLFPTSSHQHQHQPLQPTPNTQSIPALDEQTDMVDLGGGALLKRVTRDMCLSSCKGSHSRLTRNLLQAFFSEDTLANSCAEGTLARGNKSKQNDGLGRVIRPPLPINTVKAIKDFVCSRFSKVTEREIVQVINCQCSDSRKRIKARATMTPAACTTREPPQPALPNTDQTED